MQIIGNETIFKYLRLLAFEDKLSPSYLFVGPKGVGKYLAARWFASAVLCSNKSEYGPCGFCTNCKRIESGNHPDVSVLTNADNKITIGIDEVREAIATTQTCSYEGGYRFWIIDEAQRLTEEAQNALLKTLEEPPDSLIIILVAQPEKCLLPTVVSRCRRFEFRALPYELVQENLLARGFEKNKALTASRISEGSLGAALSLVQNSTLWDCRVAVLEILASLSSQNQSLWGALSSASNLEKLCNGSSLKEKDHLLWILAIASSFYRDLLLIKASIAANLLINEDYGEILHPIASEHKLGYFEKNLEAVNLAKYHVERNVKTTLILQNLCLTLQEQK